ncbi:cob(I)yrinic acid a,c-diamide adenosyltransferase [candidate division NPL-UPA2 bacterium]|nr:cob(I)yrinic acid a,c-diamide adenosyltransferase [candidate division NPL-UPA2 bacterium]
MKPKLERGLIQVYTGKGKGKTTAAMGLAARAVGQGLRVCFLQFLKDKPSGEVASTRKLGICLIRFPGTFCFGRRLSQEEKSKLKAEMQQAFFRTEEIVKSGRYDLVILDEINFVLYKRLIKVKDALQLIKNKPSSVELVLTGRYAPPDLIRAADLVTEMLEVKHPFQRGIKSRKGIEY